MTSPAYFRAGGWLVMSWSQLVSLSTKHLNSTRRVSHKSRGVILYLLHRSEAAATATPCCAPLPMSLVDEPATCVTLMCFPAIIRFSTLDEYKQRNGIPYRALSRRSRIHSLR